MRVKLTDDILIKELKTKSPKEIAEEYGYHVVVVRKKIRKAGIVRTRHEHLINHNFFKEINHDSAYVLGFIFADGTVSSDDRNYVTIQLQRRDQAVLEYFRSLIQPTLNISNYLYTTRTGSESPVSVLSFCSKTLATDLKALGCVPRKTYKEIRVPNIPTEFYPDFIRGVFDGDGTVSVSEIKNRKMNCNINCSSLSFLNDIQRILGFGYVYEKSWPPRIIFGSIKDMKQFYSYIYNGHFCLQRKYNKFTEMISRYEL